MPGWVLVPKRSGLKLVVVLQEANPGSLCLGRGGACILHVKEN